MSKGGNRKGKHCVRGNTEILKVDAISLDQTYREGYSFSRKPRSGKRKGVRSE